MWEDITGMCRGTAASLSQAIPMIKTSHFSLYDSMSAVELMDPKMDQCYGLEDKGVLSEDKLLNPTLPKVLTAAHVLEILKKLVSYEVAFYEGASVLETTHNCVYLWEKSWQHLESRCQSLSITEEERLVVQCLLAYCRSLYASLWITSRLVLEADIYEDEDFSPQVSPWITPTMDSDEELLVALTSALESTRERVDCAQLTPLLELRRTVHDLLNKTNQYCQEALRYGTAMRKLVSQRASSYINNDSSLQDASLNARFQQEHKHFVDIQLLHEGYRAVEARTLQAAQIISSQALAFQDSAADFTVDVSWAFCETMARTQQTSPPRSVNMLNYVDSVVYMKNIISELTAVSEIYQKMQKLDASAPMSPLTYDHIFAETFQISERKFHILARSLYLSHINVLTAERMTDFVVKSMESWGVPGIFIRSELVLHNWIPETVVKTFYDSLKCLCICRNKLLVKTDNLLSSWAVLIGEADQIDEVFRAELGLSAEQDNRQFWMTFWALITLTQLMDLHLCLMMESDLLSMTEVDYFYWYLDHVCSTRLFAQNTLLELAHELKQREFQGELKDYLELCKSKGRKSAGSAPVQPVPPAGLEGGPPSPSMLLLRGRKELCRGLLRTAVAISNSGSCLHAKNSLKVENPYMAWSWRFIQRFRAFQNIPNPPFRAYEDFLRTVANGSGENNENDYLGNTEFIGNVLGAASNCFKAAKAAFDYARKVDTSKLPNSHLSPADFYAIESSPALLKVAISASVQTMQMLMSLKEPVAEKNKAEKKLVLDRNLSMHFPAFTII
eukprot:GSChrysophyteH1.ASY1.ANO1.2568.1 assembled CDS